MSLRQPALIAELAPAWPSPRSPRFDDGGPRLASAVSLATSVTVSAATLLLPAYGARLPGLVVAILAAEIAAAVTVLTRLCRAIAPEPMIDRSRTRATAAATVAMVPVIASGW